MDVQLKEPGPVKPKEKTWVEDRVAVFGYLNVLQVEDRLDLLHGSQGKELEPTNESVRKTSISSVEGTILKKSKTVPTITWLLWKTVHSLALEDRKQSLDEHL